MKFSNLFLIFYLSSLVFCLAQKIKYPFDFTPQARKALAEEMADSAASVTASYWADSTLSTQNISVSDSASIDTLTVSGLARIGSDTIMTNADLNSWFGSDRVPVNILDINNKLKGNTSSSGIDSVGIYKSLKDMKRFSLTDYGVYNDSTNAGANNSLINNVCGLASADGNAYVYAPPGKYMYDPDPDNDGSYNGIKLYPNVPFIGAGTDRTFFIVRGDTGSFMGIDNDYNAAANWEDRNYLVSSFTLIRNKTYDNTENTTVKSNRTDAGIHLQATAAEPANKIWIDNIKARRIGKEALKGVFAYETKFTNCDVINCNFVAYTATAHRVIFDNCTVDTTWSGFEVAATDYTWPQTYDTLTTASFHNFVMSNVHMYGIKIYSGDRISFDDFFISYPDTGIYTFNSSEAAIYIKPSYSYGNTGNVHISNGFIKNSELSGIVLGPPINAAHIGQDIGDVTIDNVEITGSYRSAFRSRPDSTGVDENNIGRIRITNCNFKDNNRIEDNTYSGSLILLQNTDDVIIENSRVYNTDATLALKNTPVFLINCNDVIIRDNDFTGGADQRIWIDTLSTNVQMYNNSGLRSHDAYYDYQNVEGYYQIWNTSPTGFWVSGEKSTIGFRFTVINNDSLCTIKYNTSGAIVDTLKVH